jgi:hypothetical protein
MPGATLATVDAILKEVYGPRIEEQLQDEVVALRRIERTSEGLVETPGGKYVNFPIRVKRNHGIGYRQEEGTLPTAGKQGYTEAIVPLRYGYGRVRLTGQTIELAEKNPQAFASAMDREMDGLKADITKDQNRIVYGPQNGELAVVDADGANTVTVENVQYLEVGMVIDIVTPGTGVLTDITNRTITAINETTKVVTYSGANGTAAVDDILVRTGSFRNEPNGLRNVVDDGTVLHNIDPDEEPQWKSKVLGNSGNTRALSEGLMIQMADEIRRKGGKVSVIFTSLGVRRAYFNLLVQQRRYTDTKEFAGGFTGLPFNYGTEIPVVEDVDCPPNRMFFLQESHMFMLQSKDWHWADDDGTVLKWVRDLDAFEAVLRKYHEMGTNRRNAHGVIEDITEG